MKLIDLYSKIAVESWRKFSSIRIDNLSLRFWDNGNLNYIGNWKNGKKHGEWKHFYAIGGNLFSIENWENGNLKWVQKY